MYYYILDMNQLATELDKAYKVIPYCASAIQSMCFNPFISLNDFEKILKGLR